MSESPNNLSHHSSGLEPSAFQAQLRRLESLQTLMSQGGLVVGEVAQFVIKAREELSAFEREQLSCVSAQQTLVTEREQLAARVQALEKSLEQAELVAHEQELIIGQLRGELSAQKAEQVTSQTSAQKTADEEVEKKALEKIRELQNELARVRSAGEQKAERAREAASGLVAGEIALLKARICAMEQQLEVEKERRIRLMDVVKAHEVHVIAKRTPEVVT